MKTFKGLQQGLKQVQEERILPDEAKKAIKGIEKNIGKLESLVHELERQFNKLSRFADVKEAKNGLNDVDKGRRKMRDAIDKLSK